MVVSRGARRSRLRAPLWLLILVAAGYRMRRERSGEKRCALPARDESFVRERRSQGATETGEQAGQNAGLTGARARSNHRASRVSKQAVTVTGGRK